MFYDFGQKDMASKSCLLLLLCLTTVAVNIFTFHVYLASSSFNVNNGIIREFDYLHASLAKYSNVKAKARAEYKALTQLAKKPKLILHVGPRKTASTTIQHFIFWWPDDSAVANELNEDNFKRINYDWADAHLLVQECILKLPRGCDMNEWHRFTSIFDEAYTNKQHVALSNEAFSLIRPTEDAKALLLTLTERWDVRVIIAYRSLGTWYPSMYNEERVQTFHRKKKNSFWDFSDGDKVSKPCNLSFAEYFTDNWKHNSLGDPLDTLETYQYIFGKDKVKTIMTKRPDEVDITQQFICDSLEAKLACAKVKITKIPYRQNMAKRFLVDHDLLVHGAHRNKILGTNCKRHTVTLQLEDHLNELNMTLSDLPQVCISAQHFDELKKRAWIAETKMSPFPSSWEDFDESFTKLKKESTLCSVDVNKVLSNQKWVDFFKGCDSLKPPRPRKKIKGFRPKKKETKSKHKKIID